MTPRDLIEAANKAAARWPFATLVKNGMGNLSAVVNGEYVGFIDLQTGDVVGVDDV